MDKMLEKDVERKVVSWARAHGWLTWKWSAPGRIGVPDRIFIRKGAVCFIEFKRPGAKPRGIQLKTIAQLRDHGMTVGWYDNPDLAVEWLRSNGGAD